MPGAVGRVCQVQRAAKDSGWFLQESGKADLEDHEQTCIR